MKWDNLTRVMEEYKEFIDEAMRNNMPAYYELKKTITFDFQINDNLFEISFEAPDY